MRNEHCLNGEWNFMPLYGQRTGFGLPSELVYEEQKVQVPSSWRSAYEKQPGKNFGEIPQYEYAPYDLFDYPKEWANAEAGVLHRTFCLPPSMNEPRTRIFLRMDGIMQKAAVYLDHHQIAIWEDGYLPLLVEITEFVKNDTEHELHVVCGSFDKVEIPSGQQKITGLAGSWFGSIARGIWQDVYLESRPDVWLEDVSIRTSVRENRLDVDAAVIHPLALSLKTSYKAILYVRENGDSNSSPILQAETDVLLVSGQGSSSRLTFLLDWENAKCWNPEQPFLYRLELVLLDGERAIDRMEQPFGFREIWTEGSQFILNGTPFHLRGDSWHFQGAIQQTQEYVRTWYGMCKEAGVNCVRLHAAPHPTYYLDIADEMGMLIVDETAIYGSSKSMPADHPDYIANCKAHVSRLVERDRNHPSVILWSLQNEMRWVDGRDTFKQHMPFLMNLIRELDPTRPIIAEGDNRLLSKAHTEIESRHYNIDGTIDGWDRKVPLVFGEHGGWWYVCPQNSSMYVGLAAYRNTDDCIKGLAEKERLFVEYARRHGVSGISTFNFAHYFMRAMPERDILLPPSALNTAGPKPKVIPKYSLTLNNGLLPKEYPLYMKNPSFPIMEASFKPATMIPAEYNRSFFDDEPITRSFDVYNDTFHGCKTRIECEVRQEGRLLHQEFFAFNQEPANHEIVTVTWRPEPVKDVTLLHFYAVMFHDDKPVHELDLQYKLYPSHDKTTPVSIGRPVAYIGRDEDFDLINTLVPGCKRISLEQIGELSPNHLVVTGSGLEDEDGQLEMALQDYVRRGGRLLLLEQFHLSLGNLTISRQDFIRAHSGSYDHPVLQGLNNHDLMYWDEKVREDGPPPIIRAAFEKPIKGNFNMILECSAGDFGDGGDLWSPLLEYRSGNGLFIANQLQLMDHFHTVPAACCLLRNMLAYAGNVETISIRTGAWVEPGGAAEHFMRSLCLSFDVLGSITSALLETYHLIIVEPHLLSDSESEAVLSEYVRHGGKLVVLPAVPGHEAALSALLKRPVSILKHETYHLEAIYDMPGVQGLSPVDLFGYDKVFLSPREVVNRPLASYSLDASDTAVLCTSVEGTAWKDYFVNEHTSEYSRLALVELNRENQLPAGSFVLQAKREQGCIVLSQLLLETDCDKSIRLYSRLLANLGATFDDGLLFSSKEDAHWSVEKVMALPCKPWVNYEAMKAYYTDPEFSLNNLGEGLYGWMLKKERRPSDGAFLIQDPGNERWFLSCFVHVLDPACDPIVGALSGKLQVNTNCEYEIYLNGSPVPDPDKHIELRAGINRLIAIVQGYGEDIRFGLVFKNAGGSYMRHLQYRLTLDDVEPK
ncbi:glycoside hydrolase family 2 [Paenibacillus sp. HJL G12]|uniref:Glycoside hydrolase family 2 n=1 Tax=Paenibacillus dendrobii TaxID=2691084 RepID=A0A7X3LHL0_9BACL|nr:glycoside hydrolase family 2 TIM barrel-domain containing protein [Paenibacillus dendrobii]MWV44330.1 glycoside hydrolase family 2 [Paenibacillus dendrobii]